jgi:3-hydroxy-9,10-secoandrosta-1,3,5(10)-triene-9,17-dione monooxygenase
MTPREAKDIPPPQPNLTAAAMLARASALVSELRARQPHCEALGRLPDESNQQFLGAGFFKLETCGQ